MRDHIARGHYNRALARSANVGYLPLEADGPSGRSCWPRLLLIGATLGRLGMCCGLEARTTAHGIARWCHDSERHFSDDPCFFPHKGALRH